MITRGNYYLSLSRRNASLIYDFKADNESKKGRAGLQLRMDRLHLLASVSRPDKILEGVNMPTSIRADAENRITLAKYHSNWKLSQMP